MKLAFRCRFLPHCEGIHRQTINIGHLSTRHVREFPGPGEPNRIEFSGLIIRDRNNPAGIRSLDCLIREPVARFPAISRRFFDSSNVREESVCRTARCESEDYTCRKQEQKKKMEERKKNHNRCMYGYVRYRKADKEETVRMIGNPHPYIR